MRGIAAWILAQGLSAERPLARSCPTTASITRCSHSRRHACRRVDAAGDFAGLFADVRGFRQAQEHDNAARAQVRSMSTGTKRCGRARRDKRTASHAAIIGGSAKMTMPFRSGAIAATRETSDVAKAFAADNAPDTIAKFLFTSKLDRHAEGRHQHPAHADLRSAGQGADLERSWKAGGRRPLSSSSGCRGATYSRANHNFNLVLRAMAGRSMSMAASPRRACSATSRWRTCAAWCRRSISTCARF